MKIIFANYLNLLKNTSNKYKCLKVLHKISIVKFQTTFWKKLSRRVGKQKMFGKRCSENFSKILSEPCQTSKIEFFAKIVNGQKPFNIFAKSSL